jgi:hypothetical protein
MYFSRVHYRKFDFCLSRTKAEECSELCGHKGKPVHRSSMLNEPAFYGAFLLLRAKKEHSITFSRIDKDRGYRSKALSSMRFARRRAQESCQVAAWEIVFERYGIPMIYTGGQLLCDCAESFACVFSQISFFSFLISFLTLIKDFFKNIKDCLLN